MEKIVVKLNELHSYAARLARGLRVQRGASVIALHGDLGSGKTTFVQAAARALGIEERVTSPTFVIEKVYKIPKGIFSHLIHIDTYRLESEKELVALGFETLLKDPQNLIFIEWAEKVEALLPKESIHITLETLDEVTRKLSLTHDN